MSSVKPTRCSKNYVDCRRHPVSSLTKDQLALVRVEASNKEYLIEYRNANEALEPDSQTPLNASSLAKTRRVSLYNYYSSLAPNRLKSVIEKRIGLDGHTITDSEASKIEEHREYLLNQEKVKIEKEEYYSKPSDVSDFQLTVASMLIDDGSFHQKNESWGDTRGHSDYHAQDHFKQCGVYGVDNYDESASWSIYDTMSTDDYVGVSAELSCNCGEHYKSKVFMENMNFNDIVKRLMR